MKLPVSGSTEDGFIRPEMIETWKPTGARQTADGQMPPTVTSIPWVKLLAGCVKLQGAAVPLTEHTGFPPLATTLSGGNVNLSNPPCGIDVSIVKLNEY